VPHIWFDRLWGILVAHRLLLHRRVLPAAILGLTLALAACSGAGDSSAGSAESLAPASAPPAPAATDAATDAAEAATDAATGGSAVTLISPGEEPRTELRYEYTDGQRIAATMRQSQSLTQTIDGQAGPTVEYTVLSDLNGEIQTDGDTFTARTTIENVRLGDGADPAIEQQLNETFSLLNGVTTVTTTDNRGQILDSSVENAEALQAQPMLMQMVESMVEQSNISVPLPQEPVGVGARWSSMQEINSLGMAIRQTTETELRSLDGSLAELAVTSTQEPPESPVTLPGGVEIEIHAWEATSEGIARVDLTDPTPRSQGQATAHQEMTTTAQGQSATLEQDLTADIEVSPN
jgi:hypothetical protein